MTSPRRLPARAVVALALVAGLVAAAWLWVRDSSLASVRKVSVSGATTSEQGRVRAALEEAARDMTTLHVREDALEDAVASYPSVAGLRVRTDFPDRLDIEVIEHRPVAALVAGSRRVPASADGVVLTGVEAGSELPSIAVGALPADRVPERARRTRAALAVAGAAPAPLLERTERLRWGPKGLTVDLRDGPPLIFGDRVRPRAKWTAAARVLTAPSAAGATYLDLRVTGRVAAGGVGPVAQETPEVVPQP